MKKRIFVALGSGAVLGIFCILGATVRLGWPGNQLLIFSLWYNRLVMGLLIGLAGDWVLIDGRSNWILRGAILGLVVSAAYFLTAGGGDWVSFLVGPVYGIIIEFILQKRNL